jgi:hypothetical protein
MSLRVSAALYESVVRFEIKSSALGDNKSYK